MRSGRGPRVAFGAVGFVGLSLVIVGVAGVGAQGIGCTTYPAYSALASAAAQRTSVEAPGLLPVNEADNGLPASQAEFDSRSGSTAQAGAPYSELVAGNIGLTGVNRNDVPVFAVSKWPADPKVEKSSPTSTLKAETTAESAEASTEGGGGSDQGSAGRLATAAIARCGTGRSIEAIADNRAEMVDVAGVLRFGAVSSHARAVVDAAGTPTFEATMDVDGATVLGQRVAITDKGVVTGSSATPLPGDDPLAEALLDAGITVRYIAAEQDAERGQVFAPGLEITYTRRLEGFGTGPTVTTITLGRAYARAALTSDELAPTRPDVPTTPTDVGSGETPVAPRTEGSVAIPPSTPTTTAAPASPPVVQSPSVLSSLADWSVARVYTAVGLGLLLMTISLVGWRSVGTSYGLHKFKVRLQ